MSGTYFTLIREQPTQDAELARTRDESPICISDWSTHQTSFLVVDRIGEQARLPLPLTPFVGRRDELERPCALLVRKDVRLLTVTGLGGVGKTRLALEAARRVSGEFPDGVAFVNLGPIGEPALVGVTIARALGIRDVGAELPQARLSRVLAQARRLLVLDNFEKVVAAAPS